jgi:hypothetical protein
MRPGRDLVRASLAGTDGRQQKPSARRDDLPRRSGLDLAGQSGRDRRPQPTGVELLHQQGQHHRAVSFSGFPASAIGPDSRCRRRTDTIDAC